MTSPVIMAVLGHRRPPAVRRGADRVSPACFTQMLAALHVCLESNPAAGDPMLKTAMAPSTVADTYECTRIGERTSWPPHDAEATRGPSVTERMHVDMENDAGCLANNFVLAEHSSIESLQRRVAAAA